MFLTDWIPIEQPEKGAAVPKFGDWDVNDPKSAEGYTHIFDQVRDQKNARDGRVPGNETPCRTVRKQDDEGKVKKVCVVIHQFISFLFSE